MSDLALDPVTGDFLIVNGDLALTNDAQAETPNPVLQNILQRLRFFYGEWFLDNTQGIQWFEQILVKNPDLSKVDAILLNAILATPGVASVSKYDFNFSSASRQLSVSFSAITTAGPVSYSGTVGA